MKLPGYSEKSGDPKWDNWSRNSNRTLHRMAKGLRFSGPGGRKRKKHVLGIERGTYIRLIHEAAMLISLRRDRQKRRLPWA